MHGRRGWGKQVWKAKTTSGLLLLSQGKHNSCVRTLSFVLQIVRILFFFCSRWNNVIYLWSFFRVWGVFFLAFEALNKIPFSKLPCPSSVTRTSVYKQFHKTAHSLTAGVLKDSRKSARYTSFPKKRFIRMLCCIFMQNAIKKCPIFNGFCNVLQTM